MYRAIDSNTANQFLINRHYSGRLPQIVYAFGEFENNELVAVVTYGEPASGQLCEGVCGAELKSQVLELNRLCRVNNYCGILSKFVSWSLKQLGNKIIISYSDTAMNHHGYIYQALNFLYTGKTALRTDFFTEENKHSRHYDKSKIEFRKIRFPKHRYVLFVGNKRFRKFAKSKLLYPVMDYPKGDNDDNYALGFVLPPMNIRAEEKFSEELVENWKKTLDKSKGKNNIADQMFLF